MKNHDIKTIIKAILIVLTGIVVSLSSPHSTAQEQPGKNIRQQEQQVQPNLLYNYVIGDSSFVTPYTIIERSNAARFGAAGSVELSATKSNELTVLPSVSGNDCYSCAEDFDFKIHFHAGGDNVTYAQWSNNWNQVCSLKVKVEGWTGSSWITIQAPDGGNEFGLTISSTSPEQVAIKNIASNHPDRCCVGCTEPTYSSLRFTITSLTLSGDADVDANLRLDVSYRERVRVGSPYNSETVFNTVVKNSTNLYCQGNNQLFCKNVGTNPVTFDWDLDACNDEFESYQIQILRLYNIDESRTSDSRNIKAKVDWSQALTVETENKEKTVTLTLAEGSGYYLWRVRPIKKIYPNGTANPLNLGTWSVAPADGTVIIDLGACSITNNSNTITSTGVFFYNQFDENKNWSYSRSFSEAENGPRIAEGMVYSNALLAPMQVQQKLQSKDSLLVMQQVFDYSGRASLTSMSAPINQNKIQYKERLLLTGSGGAFTSKNYNAGNFDADNNFGSPQALNSYGAVSNYYSDNNSLLYIPDAEGYSYTRTLFYPDGRVREVGGPGNTMRIRHENGWAPKTSRIYFGDVSEQELTSILGDEAPAANSCTKTITVDPNDIASVQYISKEGKVIATCLTNNGELGDGHNHVDEQTQTITEDENNPQSRALLDLVGEKVNKMYIEDDSAKVTKVSPNLRILSKRLTFMVQTTVDIQYDIVRKLYDPGAGNAPICHLCHECDYDVHLDISDALEPEGHLPGYPQHLNSPPLQTQGCQVSEPHKNTMTAQVVFQPGTYIIKIYVENNKPHTKTVSPPTPAIVYEMTAIEERIKSVLDNLEYPTRESFINRMFDIATATGVHVEDVNHPTAQELLNVYTYHRNALQGKMEFPSVCRTIYLPEVQKCPDAKFCESATPDFEQLLFDEFGISKDKQIGGQKVSINYFFRDENDNPKFPFENAPGTMPQPYKNNRGQGFFNKIVANMIAEQGYCHYDCQQLWNCWRSAVSQYKSLQDGESAQQTGTADEHFKVRFQAEKVQTTVDLLELFLECTGRKIKGWKEDGYTTNNDGYLEKPYSYFRDPKAGNGRRDYCVCVQFNNAPPETLLSNCPENPDDVANQPWAKLWHCMNDAQGKVSDYTPGGIKKKSGLVVFNECKAPGCNATLAEWDEYKKCQLRWAKDYTNNLMYACSTDCNKNRATFERAVRDEYTRNNLSQPTTAEVDCKVQLLISDCLNGCKLTVDPNTAAPGTSAEWEQYSLRRANMPETRIWSSNAPNCPNGFRQLPDPNTVNTAMKYIVGYLNEQWKIESQRYVTNEHSPVIINFRLKALYYAGVVLQLQDIPSCLTDNTNDAWWTVKVYKDLPGTFFIPPAESESCSPCRIQMKKPVIVDNHPWLGYLNSYLDNLWGLEISNQSQVPALSSNKSECNFWYQPDAYHNGRHTMSKFNYGKHNTAALGTGEYSYEVNVEFSRSDCGSKILSQQAPAIYAQINAFNIQLQNQLVFDNVNGVTSGEKAFRIGDYTDYYNKLSTYYDTKNKQRLGTISTGHQLFPICLQGTKQEIGYYPTAVFYRLITQAATCNWLYFGGIQLAFPNDIGDDSRTNTLYDNRPVFTLELQPHTNTKNTGSQKFSDLFGIDRRVRVSYRDDKGNSKSGYNDDVYRPSTKTAEEFRRYIPSQTNSFTTGSAHFEENVQGYLVYDCSAERNNYGNNLRKVIEAVRFYYWDVSQLNCDMDPLCNPQAPCLTCIRWNPIKAKPGDEIDPRLAIKYVPDPCEEQELSRIKGILNTDYNTMVREISEIMAASYKRDCDIYTVQDALKVKYELTNYHYTLYYYDRTGNLVRTVPPKGVKIDPTRTRAQQPNHDMPTMYVHDSRGQLRQQQTPDGGVTRLWYNKAGQLRLSQTARQAAGQNTSFGYVATMSYIKYDYLGRVTESGEIDANSVGSSDADIQQSAESTSFPSSGGRRISRTYYGTPSVSVSLPTPYSSSTPANITKRVYLTEYDEDGNSNTTTDRTRMWYSYDVHGNVEWAVHEVPGESTGVSIVAKTEYDYDLLSGKVNMIRYRKGFPDQFFRRFGYDRDNRLITVETSRDTVIWEKDASYEYYNHGPLRRIAMGEDSVQAMDYVYTLQGWVKGMNHPSLDPAKDPGGDGNAIATGKTRFPVDAFGMTLGYYAGDFHRQYPATNPTEQSPFNSSGTMPKENLNAPNALYNGNISSWVTNTQASGLTGNDQPVAEGVTANIFRYDVLNRLRTEGFKVYDPTQQDWNNSPLNNVYDASYIYDANGNILTLKREAAYRDGNGTPTAGAMDNFNYTYNNAQSNNRLHKVDDNAADDALFTTAGDMKASNLTGDHYEYYDDGSLKKDNREGITDIRWSPGSKVEQITKSDGTTVDILYDASGSRVRKKTVTASGTKLSYYLHGAFGMQEAVYEQAGTASNVPVALKEVSVYGGVDHTNAGLDPVKMSKLLEDTKDVVTHAPTEKLPLSRMALCTPTGLNYSNTALSSTNYTFSRKVDEKVYELKDHLGNIRAVLGDVKKPDGNGGFTAWLKSYTNYYGFGMAQPERSFASSSYRYGYNGQEKDDEIAGEGNSYTAEFWQYDSRLGRRWNLDPKPDASFCLYSTFANNPIMFNDVLGDSGVVCNNNKGATVPTDEFNKEHLSSQLNSFIGKWENPANRSYAPTVAKHLQTTRVLVYLVDESFIEYGNVNRSDEGTTLALRSDLYLKPKSEEKNTESLEKVFFHELVHHMNPDNKEFQARAAVFAAGYETREKVVSDFTSMAISLSHGYVYRYMQEGMPQEFQKYFKYQINKNGAVTSLSLVNEKKFLEALYNYGRSIIDKK